jgi:hypothetical protein
LDSDHPSHTMTRRMNPDHGSLRMSKPGLWATQNRMRRPKGLEVTSDGSCDEKVGMRTTDQQAEDDPEPWAETHQCLGLGEPPASRTR